MKTFNCKCTWSDLNWTKISVTSPKTGNILHINQGWFEHLTKELTVKIAQAVRTEQKKAGKTGWMKKSAMVELTINELTSVKTAFDAQEKSRRKR